MTDTNTTKSGFHLGKLIRAELDRQNLSIKWFAAAINSDRSNCYDIFERKFINIELLERISKVLKRNFFKDLVEYEEGVVKNSTKM